VHERDAVLDGEADLRQPRDELVLAGRRERKFLVELDQNPRATELLALAQNGRAELGGRSVSLPDTFTRRNSASAWIEYSIRPLASCAVRP
jgi:hypothetical protein